MDVLRTAILDFCRRSEGKPFCPTEVVRRMFPEDWELFIEEIRAEARRMHRENLIELSQVEDPTNLGNDPAGSILIIGLRKPK
jgi:hypothetical protein